MKKIFCIFGIAALLFSVVGCKDPKKPDVNDIVEDGVYVTGPATGATAISAVYGMAKGINEANDQTVREGMYEKYIVLEANKDFSLTYVNGGEETAYGANLEAFTPADVTGGLYQDNPATAVYKGALVIGSSAPKMKVTTTGLYHIVLDLNVADDLDFAQIVVVPVEYGVRGGMNSWGFTALNATEPKNEGITYTLTGQKMGDGGTFKFAYNSAWKITLDAEGAVKANTNLGVDCKPGGKDIAVTEGAGEYKITLEFKLAKGNVENSWKYTIEQESKSETPTTMYMIGKQFGDWSWESEGVVDLVPVWGKEGAFWCTRYFTTDGFKFCAEKAWNGDFTGLGTDEGYTVADGNCFVPAAGFYTVYINLLDKVVEIKPAEVYGMGNAVFAGGWDFNDAEKFVANGDKMEIITSGAGELRLASKVMPTVKVDGCGDNGWFDWWKSEFIFFADNKIAYRGLGGDQERVQIEANKVISIDFNAGTVTVSDFVPAATIDGDMTEWADVEAFASTQTSRIREWKFKYDAKNVYFYFKVRMNRSQENKPLVIGFDTDNNSATGSNYDSDKILGIEAQVQSFPFTNASGSDPATWNGVDTKSTVKAVGGASSSANVTVAGYNAPGEALSSDSASTYIEVSVPRSALNLPVGTPISVGCAYDWYVTGMQSVTIE